MGIKQDGGTLANVTMLPWYNNKKKMKKIKYDYYPP
jgi:hypothetical protein